MPLKKPEKVLAFDYCTITGRFDTTPEFHRSSFDGLSDFLQSHVRMITQTREEYLALPKEEQASLKDGPAVILARFKARGRRVDEEVEYTTGIGLDVDERSLELDELKSALEGYSAIVYESANSTSQSRRWRVLLPYAVPASREQHERTFEYWSARIRGIGAQSRNVSRLWYGVTQFAKARKRIFEVLYGEAFDPTGLTVPRDAYAASQAAFRSAIKTPVGEAAREGARNDALNRYATKIVSECPTYAALLLILQEMNGTYSPPLDAREVQGIALRKWKHREKFGWKDTHNTHSDEVDDLSDLFSTTADILSRPYAERTEYVENLLQIGCTLKHGPSKKGKSWFLLDMADHVAHGTGPFLGRTVRQAKVLLIGAEDNPLRFKERLGLMDIRASDQLVLMHREQLKKWGERCRLFDDNGIAIPWTPALFIEALHEQTGAKVIILDTQEVVEMTLDIRHGDKGTTLTRVHYLSTSSYDDIAQRLGIAVVLTAHWGAIKNVQLAATNPHEMINTTKTKIAGALTSVTLGPLVDQELDDDTGRMQLSVMGKDLRTGSRYEVIERNKLNQRHTLLGNARDVALRETLAEVMEVLEAQMSDGREWVTSAELGMRLSMRADTVRRKVLAIEKNARKQATDKGLADGRVYWKNRVLKSGAKGYRLERL